MASIITPEELPGSVDLSTIPLNVPSMCIPRVFKNITEERVRSVISQLGLGDIERVDMIYKKNEKGDEFQRVFIHIRRWASTPDANKARERLLTGKEIKIIYDDPWFWKVSANRSVSTPQERRPPAETRDRDLDRESRYRHDTRRQYERRDDLDASRHNERRRDDYGERRQDAPRQNAPRQNASSREASNRDASNRGDRRREVPIPRSVQERSRPREERRVKLAQERCEERCEERWEKRCVELVEETLAASAEDIDQFLQDCSQLAPPLVARSPSRSPSPERLSSTVDTDFPIERPEAIDYGILQLPAPRKRRVVIKKETPVKPAAGDL
jgi:hypothetical protein